MRWLLLKDLRILGRSPLTVAVLVLYPVVVALLLGFALSRGPDRPAIAFVNEVPEDEGVEIAGERFDLLRARGQALERVDAVEVDSREQALEMVRSGEVLAAIVVPRDTLRKLETQFERPTVEVLVNEEDPLKARLVEDTITSLLARANQRISRAFARANLRYLDLLLRGGSVTVLGQQFDVLGLQNVERIARAARGRLPAGSRARRELGQVARFAELAQQNLDLTDDILAAVGEPVVARKSVVEGSSPPLTTFAAAISVALSLMLVTVLLAAGSLALERTENVFPRLVRGPITRTGLLIEKILLAVGCAVAVTLVLLLGLGLFIPLEWGRFALWLVALVAGAAGFAAMGAAIGGIARDVSTASLVAFTLLFPIAFLALVPSGVVSAAVYDTARAISALFPFRPTLDALGSALHGEGGMIGPLVHLTALTVAFTLAARVSLRRFG